MQDEDVSLAEALEQLAAAESAFEDAEIRMERAAAEREKAEKRIAAMEQRLAAGIVYSISDLAAKAGYLARFAGNRGDKGMIPDDALTSLLEGVSAINSRSKSLGYAL